MATEKRSKWNRECWKKKAEMTMGLQKEVNCEGKQARVIKRSWGRVSRVRGWGAGGMFDMGLIEFKTSEAML